MSLPSDPRGPGEREAPLASDDVSVSRSGAKAVRAIAVLLRGFTQPPQFAHRFVPTASRAYDDLVEFLELANDWFSKYDAELPDVEGLDEEEVG